MCVWGGGGSDKKQGWGEEDTPHVKHTVSERDGKSPLQQFKLGMIVFVSCIQNVRGLDSGVRKIFDLSTIELLYMKLGRPLDQEDMHIS